MGLLHRVETLLSAWRRRRLARQGGAIGAWFRDDGEEIAWRDLPLAGEPCLDVGGYRGDWTAELLMRYGARSIVFEAVPEYAEHIRHRFRRNPLVTVHAAALGTSSGKAEIALASDGSSLTGAGRRIPIDVVDVAEVFAQHPTIGCMKLNVEGAEYDLLDRMALLGLLARVASFRIQFHGAENAGRRAAIRRALSPSHQLVFDYPFVWERWDRRGG
jgi:FkbM family methyltransferase